MMRLSRNIQLRSIYFNTNVRLCKSFNKDNKNSTLFCAQPKQLENVKKRSIVFDYYSIIKEKIIGYHSRIFSRNSKNALQVSTYSPNVIAQSKQLVNVKRSTVSDYYTVMRGKIIGCPSNVSLGDYFCKLGNDWNPYYASRIAPRTAILFFLFTATYLIYNNSNKLCYVDFFAWTCGSLILGSVFGSVYPAIFMFIGTFTSLYILLCLVSER